MFGWVGRGGPAASVWPREWLSGPACSPLAAAGVAAGAAATADARTAMTRNLRTMLLLKIECERAPERRRTPDRQAEYRLRIGMRHLRKRWWRPWSADSWGRDGFVYATADWTNS
jgi:hypothetical protein